MRILVTGGAGFIGSNVVSAFAGEHEIAVVDDLSTGSSANLHADARFIRMSILDESLAHEFARFRPDAVVHLAAQASVVASIKNPAHDWAVNVEGTRAVARAAADAGARVMISASSAAVYGDPVELPLAETARKQPASPYGHSKHAAEEVLAGELIAAGVDFASFRFSNVYGPRQVPAGEGGVVAVFLDKVASGEKIRIHGTGEQTRDFIYVGDVVSAISAALGFEGSLREGGGGGPAYNIATGNRTSVSGLVAKLASICGSDIRTIHEAAREGDILHSSLDATKARRVFGWDARIPLDIGLAATYGWLTESGNDGAR
ncbi:MAG: NAD-dependent epimerase/dehydratase family protein [Actinomycetota bacterium]|nr:NAD-dependent epimerase/dehydratase family protein [Actinomycetota bacterium]MDZ4178417.1 NAD-dependent epimerase/dehydratase family protein [Coriobacteriia bacterium]